MRFKTARYIFLLLSILPGATVDAKIVPKRMVLPNGLTLLLIEQHSLPIVSIEALIKAGSIYDPPDRAGVANLTASLLDEGTARRTAAQIADEIDFLGARLSVSAEKDYTTANLKVLKKDVERGIDLLADMLLSPRFDPNEIERVRKLLLGAIQSEKDDPMVVAERAFEKAVFGAHPYRNPVIGLAETVEKISRNDLVAFYQTHYLPNNTLLSIVGDLTEKEAVRLVKRFFKKWKKGTNRDVTLPDPLSKSSQKIIRIDKALTQSSVLLGHRGIARNHPDFYPILVMNHILGGGGFSSRLLSEIRDNRGLVYSVHSSLDTPREPGSFVVALQTKTDQTKEAIAAVRDAIQKIRVDGVSEAELLDAKAYLTGIFPLRLETTNQLATLLSRIGFYDLGLTYFEDYPRSIGKVTREDLLRVANTFLRPDQLTLVVVGNLSQIPFTEP